MNQPRKQIRRVWPAEAEHTLSICMFVQDGSAPLLHRRSRSGSATPIAISSERLFKADFTRHWSRASRPRNKLTLASGGSADFLSKSGSRQFMAFAVSAHGVLATFFSVWDTSIPFQSAGPPSANRSHHSFSSQSQSHVFFARLLKSDNKDP